ncbi:aminopeptidase [Nanoarchaeota archaeon]
MRKAFIRADSIEILMDISGQLKGVDIEIFKQVLAYNLKVTNEKILIIGDQGEKGHMVSPVLSNAYKMAADKLGLKSEMILEKVTLKGQDASQTVVDKLQKLPQGSVIIMNVSHRLGKLGEIGLSFRKFCQQKSHRFISASSLGVVSDGKIKDIIDAYNIDYDALSKKANKIKEVFDQANELHITSPAGTDVTFNVQGMKARVSDGIYQVPGTGGNLPGTEVYLAPQKDLVEGKIVIDGSIRTRKGTILTKEPVEMEVKKGTVLAMNDTEESRILEETLRWAHQKAKHPWGIRRIAEFGLGLNPKAKVIGCTVIDEKTLGTGHFAIGSNYWFGGSIYAIIHLDHVFHKPKVKADGKLVKV